MAAKKLIRHITRGDVFEDLGFSLEESAALKMKAQLHSRIVGCVKQNHYTQAYLETLLNEHQPRISDLMRGKISKFSLETLVGYAEKLGLHPEMKTGELVGSAHR